MDDEIRRPHNDGEPVPTRDTNSALSTQHSASSTTDPQDELFDVLDAEGRPTGVAKRRGDVHRDGDWHGALQIWVGGIGSDAEQFVLFQRRSLTKDTWPGYLVNAIGGHIRAGETLEETVRVAEEEIGLAVTLADLTLV
jgi:isopentenyldiphosphate isomerase